MSNDPNTNPNPNGPDANGMVWDGNAWIRPGPAADQGDNDDDDQGGGGDGA